MTHREAYVFGWVYGRIDKALEDRTGKGVPDMPDPSARPLSASAQAIQAGTREGVMSELDPDVTAAYAQIARVDAVPGEPEPVQPLEIQGAWQLGYYHAKGGLPLIPPEDNLNIAARRRALKLSQAQVAEKIGVAQTQVSRWEKGLAAPSPENRKKLLAIFNIEE